MKNTNVRKTALCAILCAIALTIFVLEAQIPVPVPIPGIKLGLSNIITLFALLYLTPKDTFIILLGRILLGALFSGNPSVLIYSLSGGVICLLFEILLLKLLSKKFIIEISVLGAMIHNVVQLLCAAAVTASFSVFIYLPPLIVAGAVCGLFCGICIFFADKKLNGFINKFIKK